MFGLCVWLLPECSNRHMLTLFIRSDVHYMWLMLTVFLLIDLLEQYFNIKTLIHRLYFYNFDFIAMVENYRNYDKINPLTICNACVPGINRNAYSGLCEACKSNCLVCDGNALTSFCA